MLHSSSTDGCYFETAHFLGLLQAESSAVHPGWIASIDRKQAMVKTTEYWQLRWWDANEGSYAYAYRETNRQPYVLHKTEAGWCVFENLRPAPRMSAPHRRRESQV